jgi:phenylalanine-4-hydroxylase
MELFEPEWGVYDMAVGERIISAFAGPADPDAFGLKYTAPKEKTHHIQYTDETLRLHSLYSDVRYLRENGGANIDKLESIWQILKFQFPNEWLLPLEIAELLKKQNESARLAEEIIGFLMVTSGKNEEMQSLIGNGLELFTNS